jgi:putative ABC transport system permease protein
MTDENINNIVDLIGSDLRGYNTESDGYAKGEQIQFIVGIGDNEDSNMGKVTAVRDSSLMDQFLNSEWKLLQGRHITSSDRNKILISKELADYNNLKVGDSLKLTHAKLGVNDNEYYDVIPEKTAFTTVEIVGIYKTLIQSSEGSSPTAGLSVNL